MNWAGPREDSVPVRVAKSRFPGCTTQTNALNLLEKIMEQNNVIPQITWPVTCCCPVEACRSLEADFERKWGRVFRMGGLAGLPCIGRTGVNDYMRQISDGGVLLIIAASSIGIDSKGDIQLSTRRGAVRDPSSCGPMESAFSLCKANDDKLDLLAKGDPSAFPVDFQDALDLQQKAVTKVSNISEFSLKFGTRKINAVSL
jgi:hypothetical protein